MFDWSSNPIWLGGALTSRALAAVGSFFLPLMGPARYSFALAFICFTIATAILPVRIGKWDTTVVDAWLQVAVPGLFTLSVGLYAWRRGLGGFRASEFLPTSSVFIAVAYR